MSIGLKRHDTGSYICDKAAKRIFLAAALLSLPQTALSAVFEQRENGAITPVVDGVSFGMPLTTETAPSTTASVAVEPIAAAPSAVILDEPAGTRASGPRTNAALPRANTMGQSWSAEQQRMRRMAAEVALSYARRPGVIRARLDQDAFIALFTTMIQRESNFRPRAVSSAGAQGLGQLMPATARDLGVCDAFSPRENLQGAATYLTAMLDQFGSPSLALAAYNAGPGAVTRHAGVPPYRETRQYVADIIHAVDRMPRASGLAVESLADTATGWQDGGLRPGVWMASLDQVPDPQRPSADCLSRSLNSNTLAYDESASRPARDIRADRSGAVLQDPN